MVEIVAKFDQINAKNQNFPPICGNKTRRIQGKKDSLQIKKRMISSVVVIYILL